MVKEGKNSSELVMCPPTKNRKKGEPQIHYNLLTLKDMWFASFELQKHRKYWHVNFGVFGFIAGLTHLQSRNQVKALTWRCTWHVLPKATMFATLTDLGKAYRSFLPVIRDSKKMPRMILISPCYRIFLPGKVKRMISRGYNLPKIIPIRTIVTLTTVYRQKCIMLN